MKTVLITGGTGSFGQAFTRFLIDSTDYKVRIISRDEHKQENMERAFGSTRLTFILGDVRDEGKLITACDGVDFVIHAAALKTVGRGEEAIDEYTKTNVIGSMNVVNACVKCNIIKSILVSTDKAVSPINGYGFSKGLAEKLFIQANRISVSRGLKFSVVRGGNVWGSRGSVVEVWKAQRDAGRPIEVHNPDTTRFNLPMPDWTAFAWRALNEQHGGEIFVPKCRAWRLGDLADAISAEQNMSAHNRNGDKPHELLIAPHEVYRTIDLGWAYAVEPPRELRDVWNYQPHLAPVVYGRLLGGRQYSSDLADRLSVNELRGMIE